MRGTGPRGATPSSGGMCASVFGLRSFGCEEWNKPEKWKTNAVNLFDNVKMKKRLGQYLS